MKRLQLFKKKILFFLLKKYYYPVYKLKLSIVILWELRKKKYAQYWKQGGTIKGALKFRGPGSKFIDRTNVYDFKKSFLEIINLLNENNIPYWADSGTLLGAIRHKGIIPWDIDGDICILEQDLYKFLTLIMQSRYYYATEWITFRKIKNLKNPKIRTFCQIQRTGEYLKACDVFPMYLEKQEIPKFWIPQIKKGTIKPNEGFYSYSFEIFRKLNNGRSAYPESFMEPFRFVDFYDTKIRVINKSIEYLKIFYGNNVLTHRNKGHNVYGEKFDSDGDILTDFSPL